VLVAAAQTPTWVSQYFATTAQVDAALLIVVVIERRFATYIPRGLSVVALWILAFGLFFSIGALTPDPPFSYDTYRGLVSWFTFIGILAVAMSGAFGLTWDRRNPE
jgi:hypothetical protein